MFNQLKSIIKLTGKRGRPKIYSDGLNRVQRWQKNHPELYKIRAKAYYQKRKLAAKITKAITLLTANGYKVRKLKK